MQFFRRGFFAHVEKQELVQQLNLLLLEDKLARIATHYDGSVLLRTYFARVVYNLCVDELRRQKRQISTTPTTALLTEKDTALTPEERLLLKDELARLTALLQLLPRRYRSIICLKGWARIVLLAIDLQHYRAPRTEKIFQQLYRFFQPYDALRDAEIFGVLAALFSLVEQTDIVPDSLRRWTDLQADRLVADLNAGDTGSAYTKGVLKTFLRYHYER